MFSVSARSAARSSESLKNSLLGKRLLLRGVRGTICAADIGRNNGVCSDPEISLLTADGQQRRISKNIAVLPAPLDVPFKFPSRPGNYPLCCRTPPSLPTPPPVYLTDFYFRLFNEARDNGFPAGLISKPGSDGVTYLHAVRLHVHTILILHGTRNSLS